MNTSKPIYSGPCTYERRPAIEVTIGSLKLGGAHPVRLQSMANTDTNDTEGSVAQAERIIKLRKVAEKQQIWLTSLRVSTI